MKHTIIAAAILLIALSSAQAQADPCLDLKPPSDIKAESASLEAVKKELDVHLQDAFKKMCGGEGEITSSIRELGQDMLLYTYNLKQPGLENSQSLVYSKEKKWLFSQKLDNISEVLPSLDDDETPELLRAYRRDFRNNVEEEKSVLAYDKVERKYREITGAVIFYMATLGGCSDAKYYTEEMAIDAKWKTITLTRNWHEVKQSDCEDRVTMTEKVDIKWFNGVMAFLPEEYENSLGEVVYIETDELKFQTHLFYNKGKKKGELGTTYDIKKELGTTFNADGTVLYDFAKSGDYLFFKAYDGAWKSEYAWDVEKNKLHYRAKDLKKGKIYTSKGNANEVFSQKPWLKSDF